MNIEKLKLHSPDLATENFEKIAGLFPNCITESYDGRFIDFDLLKQQLNNFIIQGAKERYRLEWPGKRESIVLANLPTTKTLRPIKEASIDFDKTENIYIEGDNLEVLKLLQESYLGKIKLIYIDPPYNTGKDFIYRDNFTSDKNQELFDGGQIDEEKNRLVTNLESSGRYHSDWLSMMYPRLKLARNLLKDDGAIFISIDDNEIHNLKKICDEIFGENNFRNSFIARRYDKNLNRQFMNDGLKSFNLGFEYIVCYSKTAKFSFNPVFKESSEERQSSGYWKGFWNDADRPTMRYDILGFKPESGQWKWKAETALEAVENYKTFEKDFKEKISLEEYWEQTGKQLKFIRRNPDGKGKNKGVENWIPPTDGILRNTNWLDVLVSKSDVTSQGLFDFPKNIDLISIIIQAACESNDIVLDFFSGSGTTAHSVMLENVTNFDYLKYILVQIPEPTDTNSEAYNAGYKNICEIGKERIRRAAQKIKDDFNKEIDTGFRVFRLSESNMEDVFYKPHEYSQSMLDLFSNNIKKDRTSEDLLIQIMIDWGLPLSLKIDSFSVFDKTVFKVAYNSLYACFDNGVDEELAKELAKSNPLRIVFKDSGFKSDTAKANVKELIKQLSPDTEVRVL